VHARNGQGWGVLLNSGFSAAPPPSCMPPKRWSQQVPRRRPPALAWAINPAHTASLLPCAAMARVTSAVRPPASSDRRRRVCGAARGGGRRGRRGSLKRRAVEPRPLARSQLALRTPRPPAPSAHAEPRPAPRGGRRRSEPLPPPPPTPPPPPPLSAAPGLCIRRLSLSTPPQPPAGRPESQSRPAAPRP
jgi:hypothetical protein